MVRVLITGKQGYIGTSFESYVRIKEENYEVHSISMRDNKWREHDFSQYDAIIHTVAIVHKKRYEVEKDVYYKVNYQYTEELARKAKEQGVSKFIFLSSASVYGLDTGVITKETIPMPSSLYGKTKYAAEQMLEGLADSNFCVTILRIPMVYGKGCTGNYARLSKVAQRISFFPALVNQRSMIYITNLCELLYQITKKEMPGIFLPQNKEYVCTSEMVQEIAKCHGHSIFMSPLFNRIIQCMTKKVRIVNKIFGSLVYDKESSNIEGIEYQKIAFKESIQLSEEA